jgi:hypothetical protein
LIRRDSLNLAAKTDKTTISVGFTTKMPALLSGWPAAAGATGRFLMVWVRLRAVWNEVCLL